jgi:hypothetical protein
MTVHTDTGTKTAARSRAVIARAAALLVAGFFVLHALAHLVGLKDIWGIGAGVSNATTYLTGLDPHSPAYAALGVIWLAACVLFVVAAAGIVLRRGWWLVAAFAAAGVSLAVCVVWKDAAIVGLVVNAVILAGLAVWTVVRRLVGAH